MSPTPSTRRLILEAFRDRVLVIAQVSGYHTDAGRQVFVGEIPGLGPDDPPDAIAIVGQPDEWKLQGKAYFVNWPITIMAVTRADRDAAYLALEDILADITRAVELDDIDLGGLVIQQFVRMAPRQTLEREEGSLVVGVGITYLCTFKEGWGLP